MNYVSAVRPKPDMENQITRMAWLSMFRILLSPVVPRCTASPALEGPLKRALFGKAEKKGQVDNAEAGIGQISLG